MKFVQLLELIWKRFLSHNLILEDLIRRTVFNHFIRLLSSSCCNDKFCIYAFDAVGQLISRKSFKYYTMYSTNSSASQQGNNGLFPSFTCRQLHDHPSQFLSHVTTNERVWWPLMKFLICDGVGCVCDWTLVVVSYFVA
jgi:hypothetical protein